MNIRLFAATSLAAASLGLAGCATLEEAAVEAVSETSRATLTAAQLVGTRGDPDGSARAELSVANELDSICYDLNDVQGLSQITAVTIHRGTVGRTGPVVLRAQAANEGGWRRCVQRAEWLEAGFERSPGAYYIQVATTEYPNGAIRGQFVRN